MQQRHGRRINLKSLQDAQNSQTLTPLNNVSARSKLGKIRGVGPDTIDFEPLPGQTPHQQLENDGKPLTTLLSQTNLCDAGVPWTASQAAPRDRPAKPLPAKRQRPHPITRRLKASGTRVGVVMCLAFVGRSHRGVSVATRWNDRLAPEIMTFGRPADLRPKVFGASPRERKP